jgi:peptide/nickel transport system substrate-binding protein
MDNSLVTAVAADLLKIGVKAEIRSMDWGTYIPFILRDQEEVEHRLYVLGWSTLTGDADYGLYPLFYSGEWPKKGTNASFFKNETLDQLLDAARSTANPKERKRLYKEAMGLIVEEAPWIFLYSEMEMIGVRASVKDIMVRPPQRVIVKQVTIEQE